MMFFDSLLSKNRDLSRVDDCHCCWLHSIIEKQVFIARDILHFLKAWWWLSDILHGYWTMGLTYKRRKNYAVCRLLREFILFKVSALTKQMIVHPYVLDNCTDTKSQIHKLFKRPYLLLYMFDSSKNSGLVCLDLLICHAKGFYYSSLDFL